MTIKGTRPLKRRLGLPGYARVLARIYRKSATMQDLMSDGLLGNHTNGHALLAALHKAQRIHIAGWHEVTGCRMRAVWAYGSGDDAPVPETRGVKGKKSRRTMSGYVPTVDVMRPSHLCFEDLLSQLDAPRSVAQLAEGTGMNPLTVRMALKALGPLVRVAGRRRTSTLWQLREAMSGKPQQSRSADGLPRVASVFDLGRAANDARQAA